MQKILRYTDSFYSLLVFAPFRELKNPAFSFCLTFFSFSANILTWSRSCLVGTLIMQVTGLFSLLPVCTQARGDGEIQTEEVVNGLTALSNQLNISPPNPEP